MRSLLYISILVVTMLLSPLLVQAQYTATTPMQPKTQTPQEPDPEYENDTIMENEPTPPSPPPVQVEQPEPEDTEIMPRPAIFPNLRMPEQGTGNTTTPTAPGENGVTGKAGEETADIPPFKMTFDAVVTMDYVFFNSNDMFKIKYHINMNGDLNQPIGVFKTSATTVAEPSGYYAKWTTGQCILAVSIASVPCEIRYRRLSDTEMELSVTFERSIMEDWESMCTFIDAPGKKFNTRGNPEKWFDSAMAKSKPSFKKLTVPISTTDNTSTRFTIPKFSAPDENIGTAEIEGLGIITLQPEGGAGEVPEVESLTSSAGRKSPVTSNRAVTPTALNPTATNATSGAAAPQRPLIPTQRPALPDIANTPVGIPPMANRK